MQANPLVLESKGESCPVLADDFRFARSLAESKQSRLREILALANRPGVLSFAVGLPAVELFPIASLTAAHSRVLPAHPESLQYGVPHRPLRRQIAALMARRGVDCSEDQVFLTAGAQQAMSLLVRLFLDPGGMALVEETVYDGIQMATRGLSPELRTVPTDPANGIDVDAVEALLESGARPAFLYLITDGHNPLGVSLSREQRRRLADLARTYRMPILEDDAYGFLHYDGTPEPPIKALEDRWVFYMGSFSKVLAPSVRAGWMVVPRELVPRLSALKHGTDLDISTFSQTVVASYLETGALPTHISRLRGEYRSRRDAMLGALHASMPRGVTWNRPEGGMFIWLELPRHLDSAVLLRTAIETEGVAYSPGESFAVGGHRKVSHCLRLAFANLPPAQIEDGVERLARIVREALA